MRSHDLNRLLDEKSALRRLTAFVIRNLPLMRMLSSVDESCSFEQLDDVAHQVDVVKRAARVLDVSVQESVVRAQS